MNYQHFVASAVALGRAVRERHPDHSAGQLILACVKGTQRAVGKNTNLGTILLFGPLVKAASLEDTHVQSLNELVNHTAQVLSELSAQDSADVYQAIVAAKPGGMGEQIRE